jgi:hypothetical protein
MPDAAVWRYGAFVSDTSRLVDAEVLGRFNTPAWRCRVGLRG